MRPAPPLCWTARPMLAAALLFGVGVALAQVGPGLGSWLALAALTGLTAASVLVWPQRRLVTLRPLAVSALTAATVLAAGGARYAAYERLPPDDVTHVAAWADASRARVTLWGTVAKAPTAAASGTRLWLDADSAAVGENGGSVSGRVQVTLRQPRYGDAPAVYPPVGAGDRLAVAGRLRPLPAVRNPADFDYGAYLRRQHVRATLSLYDAADLAVLDRRAGPVLAATAAAQRTVRARIDRHVGTPEARALLYALLLADRSALDHAVQDAFRQTGLMHLLAVSGLHVLLVGLALFHLLKPVLTRAGVPWRHVEVARAAATLVVLGGYVLLTGAPTSVVRAFVMAALFVGGHVLQRQTDALNTLGLAAVVLLVLRPAALFDVGFQLSFAAVAGLVLLTPLAERATPARWWRPSPWRWALQSTAATLAATLATAPVLAYHFGAVPLAGLALNLVAVQLTAGVLLAGLLVVATAAWAAPLAHAYGGAVEAGAALLLATAHVGERWLGGWAFDGFVRDPGLVAAAVAFIFALAAWPRPRLRWRCALLGLALAAGHVGSSALSGEAGPRLDVVFFDVGQGDATLVTTPRGRTVLIDAGLRDAFADQGAWTVVPHLRRVGVRRLDALVLTHPHADHYGGAQAVLEALPVGAVYTNGLDSDADLWADLMATAAAHGVPVRTAVGGTALDLDAGVRMQWLHAPADASADANDASLALRLVYGATTWLFTGDGEAAAERHLVARYGPLLASDVVQVGHHGSRTSSTPAFVGRVALPGASTSDTSTRAIVSVGRHNRYRLPHAEVLERWQDAGAAVVQTADAGAVWLRSDGHTVEEVDWR